MPEFSRWFIAMGTQRLLIDATSTAAPTTTSTALPTSTAMQTTTPAPSTATSTSRNEVERPLNLYYVCPDLTRTHTHTRTHSHTHALALSHFHAHTHRQTETHLYHIRNSKTSMHIRSHFLSCSFLNSLFSSSVFLSVSLYFCLCLCLSVFLLILFKQEHFILRLKLYSPSGSFLSRGRSIILKPT